jgi:hypothetical protein
MKKNKNKAVKPLYRDSSSSMHHRHALEFTPTNLQDPSKYLNSKTSFNDLIYNIKKEIIKKPETLNVQQNSTSLFI